MGEPLSRQEQDEGFFAERGGVFYPTDHAVVSLPDAATAQAFMDALRGAGVGETHFRHLSPPDMVALMDKSEQEAGVLARVVGSELKQIGIFKDLAQTGSHFVIVNVGDDGGEAALKSAGSAVPSCKALLYRSLAIEELPFAENVIPGPSPYAPNETPR